MIKDFKNVNFDLPEEILKKAVEIYHPGLTLACSFSMEDIVIIDILQKINPEVEIFCS